jgi:hypothetical protein
MLNPLASNRKASAFSLVKYKMTAERLALAASRPFRKIRVKDHLGPGLQPSQQHCLQASRIVADEICTRLGRRCLEINQLPMEAGKGELGNVRN